MKCPHCSSTEVIVIQGQNYCLNCGQQVTNAEPPITKVVESTQLPIPSKTIGKPSDQPGRTPLHSIIPLNSSATPSKQTLESKSKDETPSKPSSSKRLQNAEPSTAPSPKALASKPEPPKSLPTPKRIATSDNPHPARIGINVVVHHLWIATFITSAAGTAIGLYVGRDLWSSILALWLARGRFSVFSSFGLRHLIISLLVVLASLSVLYLYHTTSRAKIIYFSARKLDGRNAPSNQLDQAATSALWRLIGFDALAAIILSLLLLLQLTLLRYANLIPNVGGLLRPALLTLCQIGLMYSYVGLVVGRILGSRSIVLTSQGPFAAIALGWHLFWHSSSDIAVWGTEALAVSAILLLPLIAFINTGTPLTYFANSWQIELVLIGTLSGYFLFVFNLAFWSSIYFNLCSKTQSKQRQFLLGGTLKLTSSSAPLAWALIAIILIEVGTYAGWSHQNELANWLIPLLKSWS